MVCLPSKRYVLEKILRLLSLLYLVLAIALIPPVAVRLLTTDNAISSGLYLAVLWVASAGFAGIGAVTFLLKNKQFVAKLNLVVWALGAVLLSTEIFLRLFMPQYVRSDNDTLFRLHQVYGWEFIPTAEAIVNLEENHSRQININDDGMRDRPYYKAKQAGNTRIAVVGDSFVSGLEVERHCLFTELLEDSLLVGAEVMNFGVNGYGPAQQFLLLRDRIAAFSPDLVVMLLYVRNDLDDLSGEVEWVRGYTRPHLTLDPAGELVWPQALLSSPRISNRERGKKWPSSLHLLKLITDRLDIRYGLYSQPQELRLCRKLQPEGINRAYSLLEPLLGATDSLVRSWGGQFVLAVAPSIVQAHSEKYWHSLLSYRDLDPDDYDLYLPQRKIKAICAGLGIACLDLTPGLRKEAADGAELYFPVNRHWNEAGHKRVARLLDCFIRAESGLY
jgi:hypothetical protein